MNSNKSRQELIASLPPEIQKAINYSNLGQKIDKIGQEHSLHIDKVGDLYAITEMVMFGLIHPNNFVSSIEKRLEVSRGVAEMVARDVNNEIFLAIREEMKKITEQAPLLEEETTVAQSKITSNLAHDSEHPVESDEHHATLKREDILRDIEDPSPIQTPNPFARTVLAKDAKNQPAPALTKPSSTTIPSNLPVAHNDNDLPTVIPGMDHSYETAKPIAPATNPKSAPANIVTAKLGGVVVTDTTRIPQKTSTPTAPYKVDPYRETL